MVGRSVAAVEARGGGNVAYGLSPSASTAKDPNSVTVAKKIPCPLGLVGSATHDAPSHRMIDASVRSGSALRRTMVTSVSAGAVIGRPASSTTRNSYTLPSMKPWGGGAGGGTGSIATSIEVAPA